MSKVEIRRGSIREVLGADNFHELCAEYARESALEGMPEPKANFEQYLALEDNHTLVVFLAFSERKLVGFLNLLESAVPHYSVPMAIAESFFVLQEWRKSGAGVRLLRKAEDWARARGLHGLGISAPVGGTLEKVMPSMGYRHSNSVFFKPLGDVTGIPAMSEVEVGKVSHLATMCRLQPQVPIDTFHLIHGGIYARTVRIPAGVLITGTRIKKATVVILQGDALMYVGSGIIRLEGYHVLPACAGRKQAFLALSPLDLTMLFPTTSTSVTDAEEDFTDETEFLVSRQPDANNYTVNTGE